MPKNIKPDTQVSKPHTTNDKSNDVGVSSSIVYEWDDRAPLGISMNMYQRVDLDKIDINDPKLKHVTKCD